MAPSSKTVAVAVGLGLLVAVVACVSYWELDVPYVTRHGVHREPQWTTANTDRSDTTGAGGSAAGDGDSAAGPASPGVLRADGAQAPREDDAGTLPTATSGNGAEAQAGKVIAPDSTGAERGADSGAEVVVAGSRSQVSGGRGIDSGSGSTSTAPEDGTTNVEAREPSVEAPTSTALASQSGTGSLGGGSPAEKGSGSADVVNDVTGDGGASSGSEGASSGSGGASGSTAGAAHAPVTPGVKASCPSPASVEPLVSLKGLSRAGWPHPKAKAVRYGKCLGKAPDQRNCYCAGSAVVKKIEAALQTRPGGVFRISVGASPKYGIQLTDKAGSRAVWKPWADGLAECVACGLWSCTLPCCLCPSVGSHRVTCAPR